MKLSIKQLRVRQIPPDPDEAAIWWATRSQVDPVRFANDEAFAEWLADADNARAWAEMERRMEMVSRFATMPEIRDMRCAALDIARDAARHSRRRWGAGVAVAAALLLGLTWVAPPGGAPAIAPTAATDHVQRFATAVGQSRDITLPDGSKVSLNTSSLIEVRYTPDSREVRLLQGQAMFHVARNPDRPFIVAARDRQVTALGTAFDVEIRQDGQIQVLLVEGKVRVDPVRRRGLERLIPAIARTDLEPGDLLVTEGPDEVSIISADVERETAWNRGVLIFRNDDLSDAIKEVNRYSSVQLIVDDPSVARLKVSGIFPTASREDFVAAIETLYPLAAQSEQGGTIRLTWRGKKNQPD